MNVIKLVLAGLVAAAIVLFSVMNSRDVLVDLGTLQIEIWLPLLVFLSFLCGILPTWVWMAVSRSRLRRKLTRTEDELAQKEQELAEAKVELLRSPAALSSSDTAGTSAEPLAEF